MNEFGKDALEPQGGAERTERVINDGITEFLEDNGYEGGNVSMTTEDDKGEEIQKDVPFNELNPEQKYNIINSITEQKMEGKYDLTDSEVETINNLREKGMTLDDYTNATVESEIDKVEKHYQSQSNDYENMSEDILHTMYLKEKFPEESDEDIKLKHDVAKDLEGYDKKVSAIRSSFIEKDELIKKESDDKLREKADGILEEQRQFVVDKTFDTKKIAGWNVTKEDLNSVYNDLLVTDDKGVSTFQKEIFSSPENMVKAAYLYKNAENLFNRLETFHRGEVNRIKRNATKDIVSGKNTDTSRTTYVADNKDKGVDKSSEFSSWDDD